jgi:integrase
VSSHFARSGIYYAKVRTSTGKWIARTCETRDKQLAKRMAHMVDELAHRGKQQWDLLDSVASGQLSLSSLYSAYASNQLHELRDRLTDIDVSPIVEEWLASLRGRLASDTIQHYRVHVRSLIEDGRRFPRSDLNFARLAGWLSAVERSPATKRKYHAAMTGFCNYLRARGVILQNPMRDVRAPSASVPRRRYLDHAQVLALVERLAEPYRTIVAVMHGSGIEVSAMLRLKRRDIDLDRGEVRALGTKTKARDRVAKVEPWAMGYLREHVRAMFPNSLVFPHVNRWTVSDKHREACGALDIEDYQLRDSRHTFAVRAVRSGASFEAVAQQLGHTDTTMVVRVYARFKPTQEELGGWHRIADAQDAAKVAR